MITIPTESLNKFLAIGSIISIVVLMDICLKNYEKVEMSKISLLTKIKVIQSENDNSERAIEIIKKKISFLEKRNINKLETDIEINKEIDKIEQKLLPTKKLIWEAYELAEKVEVYNKLKFFWIILSILSTIVCLFTGYLGFYGWYLEEKRKSNL
ncbi:hypothetical protein [Acinetobacter radioresistens]|uniref:hypothetical protein n=1 Tax=Acinetobacter radioresistens TaxID=40216 RepID=UPI000E716B64|nr:hypothetical protein [Acinetobacter radioresistens]RJL71621.1 hypothetical protein D5055_08220 [Acinetobacter radioresistens]